MLVVVTLFVSKNKKNEYQLDTVKTVQYPEAILIIFSVMVKTSLAIPSTGVDVLVESLQVKMKPSFSVNIFLRGRMQNLVYLKEKRSCTVVGSGDFILATERERQLTTGKHAERFKRDFRCPLYHSFIG